MEISKEDVIELLDNYINERGMWNDFTDYITEKGYTVGELGLEE